MVLPILDYTKETGLVICANPDEAANNTEKLYISEVQKFNAYAVLFRRFFREDADKPYNSEPAVCIFKEEDVVFNSDEHILLHSILWSASKNEIYLIVGKTRVDIINARKPAEKNNANELSISNLKLAEVLREVNDKRFSAHLFGKGTFWEQSEFSGELNVENSPYIHLLNYLNAVRKNFLDPQKGLKLDPGTVDKLLVVSILVKFLEEIKDDDGRHTLQRIYRKHKLKFFSEALEKKIALDIFSELSAEFNGKIFDKFSAAEKSKIRKSNLEPLAQFLNADIDLETKQIFLWKQYKFDYLPAEVISAIYESFIQAEAQRKDGKNEKGVVYTPVHLVNFLIDEVMPLDKPELFIDNKTFRVLDPACGSGVFLVAAFKRLLQWWAINNERTTKVIAYPDSKVAQKILEDNIYGVDVKETAILVSIFGLTTALLGKLTPKQIWNNLKFQDLSERNLQQVNFFEWAARNKNKKQQFDLVIGNPPFNPETGVKKQQVLVPSLIKSLDFTHKKIPGGTLALHFFEGSMTLAKKACMILPSSILYNKAGHFYRKQIFTDYTVTDIYDFTHLRRNLFTADTPVVALIAENRTSTSKAVRHTVIQQVTSWGKKIRFEVDYYDIHYVPLEWVKDPQKQFIWKANLLGWGGRLFHLVYRLSLLPTLKHYLDDKEDSDWIYDSGYKIGGNTEKVSASFVKQGDKIIKVREDGGYEISSQIESTNLLEWFPNPLIYTPPFLVLDQVLGKENIPISLVRSYPSKKYLYFNRDFVGIHSPKNEVADLIRIYDFIKIKFKSLFRFYVLVQSGSCMVSTETEINKRDIDSIPFPEDEALLKLSDSEQIIMDDVLNFSIHLAKSMEANPALVGLQKKVSNAQLKTYGAVLCETLNLIYNKEDKSWQVGKIYQTSLFTICQIGYGKSKGLKHQFLDELDHEITALLNDDSSQPGAIYKRIFRIYKHQNSHDCIYLVKPHAFRYWLKSIALRDADDTFLDLKKAGF